MIELFHRSKQWQLFVALVGTVLVFEILILFAMQAAMKDAIITNRPPDMNNFFWYFMAMMLIVQFVLFGWMWSIGEGLRHLLPSGVSMNHQRFKAFLIIPFFANIIYMLFMAFAFSSMSSIFDSPSPDMPFSSMIPIMIGMVILLPIQLFATFCIFYSYYFCAKTYKSIELGREAELGEYIGPFFLIMFSFVGFWIIQPVINRWTAANPYQKSTVLPDSDPNAPVNPFQQRSHSDREARSERLNTKNHDAFHHDDDFDGLI